MMAVNQATSVEVRKKPHLIEVTSLNHGFSDAKVCSIT